MKTTIKFQGSIREFINFVQDHNLYDFTASVEMERSVDSTRFEKACRIFNQVFQTDAPYTGFTPECFNKICAEIRRGNKIPAIKECREYTRCSLRDGKDFVEAMERANLHFEA